MDVTKYKRIRGIPRNEIFMLGHYLNLLVTLLVE